MKAIKFDDVDCDTLANILRDKVVMTNTVDISDAVPHCGYGGASKWSYLSPKTGKTIYVLERSQTYAPDAYHTEIWQFEQDFTAEEAARFIADYDKNYRRPV